MIGCVRVVGDVDAADFGHVGCVERDSSRKCHGFSHLASHVGVPVLTMPRLGSLANASANAFLPAQPLRSCCAAAPASL